MAALNEGHYISRRRAKAELYPPEAGRILWHRDRRLAVRPLLSGI
jgi:hypothetical protein